MPTIVYGANCVWWDDISKVGKLKGRSGYDLPCCPHCNGVLFQQEEEDWWQGVTRYESEGHPGYKQFVEWWRGKCFKDLNTAKEAYKLNHSIFDLNVLKWLDERS